MIRRDAHPGRYERSARFWLRAYPYRWRAMHGEEALAVVLALAGPDDGADPAPRVGPAIGAREAASLLRAGWSLRWRERPGTGRWLLYRLLDVRLPARYWWWAADDIRGALYPWRNGMLVPIITLLAWYAVPLLNVLDGRPYAPLMPLWLLPVAVILFVGIGFLGRRSGRSRAWLRHVVEGKRPERFRDPAGA